MFKVVNSDETIKKVAELANIIWHEAYKNTLSPEQINYMVEKFQSYESVYTQITIDRYDYFLICEENKEVGFFSFLEGEEIFLSKVYILKDYRQKGYLSKVINYLINKKKTITLRVNKENEIAINAYKRLGFKETKEDKSPIGEGYYMDDYIMERKFGFQDLIRQESEKPYFKKLLEKIKEEAKTNKIFPPKENWFKALELISFDDVNVVIIGQDPYYNEHQAMGLCFSVNKDVKMPPSLVNIYKEIEREYKKPMPNHGDLTGWAKQGVLLLNTILTVSEGRPMSHKGFGWEIFTDEVIKLLQEKDFVIYLLLGGPAQQYEKKITNQNHVILKTSHPSPLSCFRGFNGSGIFSKTNKLLDLEGKKKINWYLL